MLKLEANPADVATIDSIITAVYDGISGPAGKKRDWDRERSLYIPGARLIPTAMKAGTENMDLAPHILDIEGFIARVEPFFEESGFYEKEIARRTEQFGQIAHVWSTYESRHNENDPEPFMRGRSRSLRRAVSTKKKSRGAPNSLVKLRMSGAPTSRATTKTILNHLCAGGAVL